MGTAVARVTAVLMLAALLAAVAAYPLPPLLLGAGLAAYAAVLWWRPQWWLLLVPALLPAFDLAPWTGWFFVDELDLLLAATCFVGYWRIAPLPKDASLPRFFKLSYACMGIAFAISALVGLFPLQELDANAFANYLSHYNSLRVAKGFAWAALLLPLLRRSAGPNLAKLRTLFVPGMIAGLCLASLAVAWERALFPGLLNFASDYRPTAPFSAMHTGGAALDAYLALAFPFVGLWLFEARSRWQTALALAVLTLGGYAGFATFSRDIYLAFATSAAVLGALVLAHRLRRGTVGMGRIAMVALLFVLAAVVLVRVFPTSGYRGLAAALGVIGAGALLAGARAQLASKATAAGLALALLAACGLLALLTSKGAYLGYGLAALVLVAGAALLAAGHGARGLLLAAASFPALLAGSVLVATHWGGSAALFDSVVAGLFACALVAINRLPATPLWQLDRGSATLGLIGAIALAIVIPFAGSYHTGSRFATVGNDIDVRLGHWSEALAMMEPGLATSAFGMGLGTYPATYFWKNTHGEMPGSYSYVTEKNGNVLLRLGAPQYAQGFGEILRMLQQVDMAPGQTYQLALDVRRSQGNAALVTTVCKRWLIFPEDCAVTGESIKLAPADGQWHRYSVPLRSGSMGSGWLAAPTRLEIGAGGAAATLDVDNVSLRGPDGRELVSNGSFSAGHDYWFFSSDRNHFPWHAKNFGVYLLFEMGWLGVLAVGLFLLFVGGSLAERALHGELYAGATVAALAGFLVVGMFDSLFDVPRLTLACLLVASAGSLLPPRKVRVKTRRRQAAVDGA